MIVSSLVSSLSASSSSAVTPTLIASRSARAFARVSLMRTVCMAIMRPTFCGLASPMPPKMPFSVSTSA
ncbi:MAG TPA: hypothetical protein VHB98_05100 [Chloroflexota bacterium]|nr:hypothetical protein [Chloroflexota bacterium]